jgi:hypothetical protein
MEKPGVWPGLKADTGFRRNDKKTNTENPPLRVAQGQDDGCGINALRMTIQK